MVVQCYYLLSYTPYASIMHLPIITLGRLKANGMLCSSTYLNQHGLLV